MSAIVAMNPIVKKRVREEHASSFETSKKIKTVEYFGRKISLIDNQKTAQVGFIASKVNNWWKLLSKMIENELWLDAGSWEEESVKNLSSQMKICRDILGEIDDEFEDVNEFQESGNTIYIATSQHGQVQGISLVQGEHINWIATAPWNLKDFDKIRIQPKEFLHSRETGVGRDIIKGIIRNNVNKDIYVNSADQSIGFYKKLGFVEAVDPDGEMFNYMKLSSERAQEL